MPRGRPRKHPLPEKSGEPRAPRASERNGASAGSAFEQAFRNIDDVLRKEAGCTTELDYTEQTSWLLFLKYGDRSKRGSDTRRRAGRARQLSVRCAPGKILFSR